MDLDESSYEEQTELAEIVYALDSYVRLGILIYMLSLGEESAEFDKLCSLFDLQQPSVSHHIRVLCSTKIIERYRKGNFSHYRFKSKKVRVGVLEFIENIRYLHKILTKS
jgi:DNA-binding transcriptional ArsR family regulator